MEDPLKDLFADLEFNGVHWRALRENLLTQIAVLPTSGWFPSLEFPKSNQEEEIRVARQQISRVFSDEVTEESLRAVFAYIRESEWPELSPQAILFLTVFLDQVEDFLGLCYVETDSGIVSLFPYSQQPIESLYRWLVFRWWFGLGLPRWIDRVLEDRSLFDKYFSSPD